MQINAQHAIESVPQGRLSFDVLGVSPGDLTADDFTRVFKLMRLGSIPEQREVRKANVTSSPISNLSGNVPPWFAFAIHKVVNIGRSYLFVVCQQSMDQRDLRNRQIPLSQCLAIPFHQAQLLSYSDILRQFPVLAPNVLGNDNLQLSSATLSGYSPTERLANVRSVFDSFDFDICAKVASLLIETPITIVNASDQSAWDRARFIDGVLSLLPFSLRSSIAASTWQVANTANSMRLTFAGQRVSDRYRFDWRKPSDLNLADYRYSSEYYLRLQRIVVRFGVNSLLSHLSEILDVTDLSDFRSITTRLVSADPSRGLIDLVERGGASYQQVRELLQLSRSNSAIGERVDTRMLLDLMLRDKSIVVEDVGSFREYWSEELSDVLNDQMWRVVHSDEFDKERLEKLARISVIYGDLPLTIEMLVRRLVDLREWDGGITIGVRRLMVPMVQLVTTISSESADNLRSLVQGETRLLAHFLMVLFNSDMDLSSGQQQECLSWIGWGRRDIQLAIESLAVAIGHSTVRPSTRGFTRLAELHSRLPGRALEVAIERRLERDRIKVLLLAMAEYVFTTRLGAGGGEGSDGAEQLSVTMLSMVPEFEDPELDATLDVVALTSPSLLDDQYELRLRSVLLASEEKFDEYWLALAEQLSEIGPRSEVFISRVVSALDAIELDSEQTAQRVLSLVEVLWKVAGDGSSAGVVSYAIGRLEGLFEKWPRLATESWIERLRNSGSGYAVSRLEARRFLSAPGTIDELVEAIAAVDLRGLVAVPVLLEVLVGRGELWELDDWESLFRGLDLTLRDSKQSMLGTRIEDSLFEAMRNGELSEIVQGRVAAGVVDQLVRSLDRFNMLAPMLDSRKGELRVLVAPRLQEVMEWLLIPDAGRDSSHQGEPALRRDAEHKDKWSWPSKRKT